LRVDTGCCHRVAEALLGGMLHLAEALEAAGDGVAAEHRGRRRRKVGAGHDNNLHLNAMTWYQRAVVWAKQRYPTK